MGFSGTMSAATLANAQGVSEQLYNLFTGNSIRPVRLRLFLRGWLRRLNARLCFLGHGWGAVATFWGMDGARWRRPTERDVSITVDGPISSARRDIKNKNTRTKNTATTPLNSAKQNDRRTTKSGSRRLRYCNKFSLITRIFLPKALHVSSQITGQGFTNKK